MDRSFVWTSIMLQPGFCFIDSLCLHQSVAPQIEDFVLVWYSPPYIFHVSYMFCSTKLILGSIFFFLVNN
jgi:hypothetical protein